MRVFARAFNAVGAKRPASAWQEPRNRRLVTITNCRPDRYGTAWAHENNKTIGQVGWSVAWRPDSSA